MKAKTHRGTAKRFRVTRNGKVLRRKANKAHLLEKKSASRKRRISGTTEVKAERGDILRLLGRR